jgi:hypothetical protein
LMEKLWLSPRIFARLDAIDENYVVEANLPRVNKKGITDVLAEREDKLVPFSYLLFNECMPAKVIFSFILHELRFEACRSC